MTATTPVRPDDAVDPIESAIARVLGVAALVAVGLLGAGVVLMILGGIDPTAATFPPFDLAQLIPDILALRPEGFLWAGVVVVIATPIVRVIGELIGFSLRREHGLALVAGGILVVVALSVFLAQLLEA